MTAIAPQARNTNRPQDGDAHRLEVAHVDHDAYAVDMATDRPARVDALRVVVVPPPELRARRRDALPAVASHCTVHNPLHRPPAADIGLEP
ncbi:hypothetical protein [Streptomyces sp. UG1]|uniref:hypothetical protein n=1 Tax=Streptomyces sp. UG1 TaxID=3417652 RepID=UPI003CEBBDBA